MSDSDSHTAHAWPDGPARVSPSPSAPPSASTTPAASTAPSATPPENGTKSPAAAASKGPGSNRLDHESRRKLLARIAATASQRELREIQSEVIAAYLGMVLRRTGADETVEQVRDAARARLRLIDPNVPSGE